MSFGAYIDEIIRRDTMPRMMSLFGAHGHERWRIYVMVARIRGYPEPETLVERVHGVRP